jgi:hypothetical protein
MLNQHPDRADQATGLSFVGRMLSRTEKIKGPAAYGPYSLQKRLPWWFRRPIEIVFLRSLYDSRRRPSVGQFRDV